MPRVHAFTLHDPSVPGFLEARWNLRHGVATSVGVGAVDGGIAPGEGVVVVCEGVGAKSQLHCVENISISFVFFLVVVWVWLSL